MRYIPAKVVFNDTEKGLLKDYMARRDPDGKIQEAIDASTEFDVCAVQASGQNVRGFRVDYSRLASAYVSFKDFEEFILGQSGYSNQYEVI